MLIHNMKDVSMKLQHVFPFVFFFDVIEFEAKDADRKKPNVTLAEGVHVWGHRHRQDEPRHTVCEW